MAARVRLVCWGDDRWEERRAAIAAAGFEADETRVPSSKLITHIRLTQPDAVIIDLERMPSHGRAVATVLRTTKSTRGIPLVFAGGEDSKVVRLRSELPDATYGAWSRIGTLIRSALRARSAAPVVPVRYMESFRGSTLEKKLGLRDGTAVIGVPEGFLERIGVPVDTHVTGKTGLAIWFIRSLADLEREIEFVSMHPPLWIAFPKQSGQFRSDFTQHDVRRLAGRVGLVDNKVCAIDNDWSAIRFARRRK